MSERDPQTTSLPTAMDGYCVATDAGPIPWTFSFTSEHAQLKINPADAGEQRVVRCRVSILEEVKGV